jgi:polar amino acid transport system substrate-binding protein
MSTLRTRFGRTLGAATAVAALVAGLAACGSGDSSGAAASSVAGGRTDVVVAANTGAPFTQATISVEQVDSIRAKLPKSVLDSGELRIGVGALPAGFPPLAFVGTDQKTLTGAEPDVGRLVAAVLGLKPVLTNSTWENLFVGFDSGRTDVGFSNITDTDKRKEKYDFASYRQDNLGFQVAKASTWNFDGRYENLAGLRVAVSRGTNQEKILLEWKTKLDAAGKPFTVSYFPDQNSTNLALTSGKIDAYFGPNPGIAYQVAQSKGTPAEVRSAGTWSGAGESLQGLIAATTKKGSGLAEPVSEAINHLITGGQYGQWLKAYNLENEAVKTSEVNPPGLPLTNS